MSQENTFSLLMGLGCGVGIALLFTPTSGRGTRSVIAKKTREKADSLKNQATQLSDSVANLVDHGRKEVKRQTEGLKQAVEAGKQAYRSSMAQG